MVLEEAVRPVQFLFLTAAVGVAGGFPLQLDFGEEGEAVTQEHAQFEVGVGVGLVELLVVLLGLETLVAVHADVEVAVGTVLAAQLVREMESREEVVEVSEIVPVVVPVMAVEGRGGRMTVVVAVMVVAMVIVTVMVVFSPVEGQGQQGDDGEPARRVAGAPR